MDSLERMKGLGRAWADIVREVNLLSHEQKQDNYVFQTVVRLAQTDWDIPSIDFVIAFGIHHSTLERWSCGTSFPMNPIKSVVIDWIRDQLEKRVTNEGV